MRARTASDAIEGVDGTAGDVQWNFEKFLVSPAGAVLARFQEEVEPESDEIVQAIEDALPGS